MRVTIRSLIVAAVLGIVAAGCVAPAVQPAPPPDQVIVPETVPKTGPESPLISTACRVQLGAVDGGATALNTADVALGFWAAEGRPADDPEVQNDLAAFRVAAWLLDPTMDCQS